MEKWKWLRSPVVIVSIRIALLLFFIFFIVSFIGGYLFKWGWTGFPAKTLWDWLGVLATPVVAAFGVAWYTAKQTQAREATAAKQRTDEQEAAERRHRNELEVAEQQRTAEHEAAEKRYKLELDIAIHNQREASLQAYIDKIAELILTNDLNGFISEEVRKIARVRTLTVLRRLDPFRKASVLQFLHEAELIGTETVMGSKYKIIDLKKSDLSRVNLNDVNLGGADLSGANLHNATMQGARLLEVILEDADLSDADLSGADLNKARLSEAILRHANLSYADLREADLSKADLSGANLSHADLRGANLSSITPDYLFLNDHYPDAGDEVYYENLYGGQEEQEEAERLDSLIGANLEGANLEGADLRYADLRCAKGVTDEQLGKAFSLLGISRHDGSKHP